MQKNREEIIKIAQKIIPMRAISPKSGGDGESKRADILERIIEEYDVKTKRYDYIDKDGAARSNVIAQTGKAARAINIIAHIDTVAAGDLKAWKTDPFKATVIGDKIFGRGSEDDGHGIISGLLCLKEASLNSPAKRKYSLRLVLAADEEVGSEYGVVKLLNERIFKKSDMFIVPDWGTPNGAQIEVAEKGILWIKITIHGQQTHGSTPNLGINASLLSSKLQLKLHKELNAFYKSKDKTFDPCNSTFEPTKHEQNVDSINIIPGKDVFYMDMRILPKYDVNDVLIRAKRIIKDQNINADVEIVQKNSPSMILPNKSFAYKMLSSAIRQQLKVNPSPVGIGGGTVASYLRQRGYDTLVWGVIDDMAHAVNEYVRISAIEKEISVINALYNM